MVFGQDLQEIPADLNFSCDGREYGYYADPATNCQVFHICLGDGDIKWSFLCPNQTIFNQVTVNHKLWIFEFLNTIWAYSVMCFKIACNNRVSRQV